MENSRLLVAVLIGLVVSGLPRRAPAQLAAPLSPPTAVSLAAAPRAEARPWRPYAVAAQTGGALTLMSVDFALEFSRRWERFGVLVKADWNRWVNTQKSPKLTMGTLNLGVGAAYWYFGGRARTSVVAGPSILLFRTVLDKPGKVGVFVDCYPSSLYWSLAGPLFLRFDALSLHVIAPVLDSIPLVVFEYRTSIALEWRL